MRRLSLLVVVTAAAGCPPPAPFQPQAQTVGCPAAKDVYTASYVQTEPGKGRSGWVMPLFDQKAESVTGKPEYQVIDAAAAKVAGVPAPPTTIWLVQPGVQPCQARLGHYYAAAIDVPGMANVSYGIELDGCGPPADGGDGEAIALASTANPAQCRVEVPHVVAERLGEMTPTKQWKRPDKETPIPAGLTAAIPKHECTAPGCETLWTVLEVDVDNIPAAWAGAVNWLEVGDPASPCNWHADTFNGFFIPDATGHGVKVTDGQDHPLVLAGVLADSGGPKVLFADGAGEYAAYDLSHGAATVGHHVTWLVAEPAQYAVDDHIGPQCNDPNAPPPPPGAGAAGSGSGSSSSAGSGSNAPVLPIPH